ncbi:MAG TPA: Abi-alpha family protein, partial [Candidatus Saccharimonadales bacterium]|nr:Abi-alpha family protein [Candidatus Saccharimonadales bacterium]
MTDEQAKAVQEVAKTSGKLVETTGKVGGFISKIIGGASTQVGGILEDWAKFYRYKNLLRVADKVEAIHAQRKIEGKTIPIPPRMAIPLLESASLEDDETLQKVWARLIANSTDPNFRESSHPGYVEIIKQMSPDEAIILDSFLKI